MLESERIDVLEDEMNISAIEEEKMYSTLATFSMISTRETDGTGECNSTEKVWGYKLEWIGCGMSLCFLHLVSKDKTLSNLIRIFYV